jgi:hypothetical protein
MFLVGLSPQTVHSVKEIKNSWLLGTRTVLSLIEWTVFGLSPLLQTDLNCSVDLDSLYIKRK